jgi:methionyl-tRNA formyltransferase
VVFMGTPAFAVPPLDALIEAGHGIACVYSQPPRPAGRGKRPRPSPVHARAHAHDLPVRTPASLKDAEAQADFAALDADVAVVAAYGLILPPAVLAAPRFGCVNIHASLLPRWRGAAPIAHAILAGDGETGITIMRMDEGLDTGPILMQRAIPIGDDDAGALEARLARLGAGMITDALEGLARSTLHATPQPEDGVTYAPKLRAGDEALDWRQPARALARRVRALSPRPGAHFSLGAERWKVLAAEVLDDNAGAQSGTVLDDRLAVACGEGALRPLTVQRAGRRAMETAAALRGRPVRAGTVLG